MTMRKITFQIALLGLALGFLSVTAAARQSPNDPSDSIVIKQMLLRRDKQIKNLLGPKGTSYTKEQKDKLKDIVNDIIDYNAMAKVALQQTYDTLAPAQRKEFVNTFSQVVRDQSLSNLDIYRAKVTYKKIDVVDDSAFVKTIAELKNVRTPVSYVMEKENGRWYVVDFIIDNVSTAKSYERSFQNVINRKGYDTLLSALKKKAAQS